MNKRYTIVIKTLSSIMSPVTQFEYNAKLEQGLQGPQEVTGAGYSDCKSNYDGAAEFTTVA